MSPLSLSWLGYWGNTKYLKRKLFRGSGPNPAPLKAGNRRRRPQKINHRHHPSFLVTFPKLGIGMKNPERQRQALLR